MPLPTEVNLPREFHAKFPNRCVACGAEPFGNTVKLWTHTLGWWTWILWIFGSGFSVRVPACGECAWRLRTQRWGRLLATVLIALIVVFLIWPNLDAFVPRALQTYAAMAIVLLCLAPWFLWEAIMPPAVDITAYSRSVNYEFLDPHYAIEFAELNANAAWVKVTDYRE
jgi:hypothetical protein